MDEDMVSHCAVCGHSMLDMDTAYEVNIRVNMVSTNW